MLCFRILLSRRLQNICVAAKGAIRFSVRVTSVARTFYLEKRETELLEITYNVFKRQVLIFEKQG